MSAEFDTEALYTRLDRHRHSRHLATALDNDEPQGDHPVHMRNVPLGALNSATKYPSIPTYHQMDTSNGRLLPEAVQFTGNVVLTEKVDGTNARIIQFPDGGWIIGSREDLLHARGDLIHNPELGTVDALADLANRLALPTAGIRALFLEVYGGKVGGAARQYTAHRNIGYRLFDVITVPSEVLEWPRERISTWRENGGQDYLHETELVRFADLQNIPLTPRLGTVPATNLPADLDGMQQFLATRLPETRVALDEDAEGRPEGIVLRDTGRTTIAKARLADYRRTLTPQRTGKKGKSRR